MNDFARRLKDCREKKKIEDPIWTQRFVAEKIGMARTTYTAYENGTKMPPPDTINNIAILLDVSNDYLMGRTNIAQSYTESSLENFFMLPVVAKITADNKNEIISYFPADKSVLQEGEHVWLEVNGNSMINVGIRNGSKVLICLQSEVDNGDIAAVCINGNDAVLKKVYFSEEKTTLVSENVSYEDQVYNNDEIVIKGKAIYVSAPLET